MPLSDAERDLIIGLGSGQLQPSDGMQRHFVRVCRGDARPVTPTERQWYANWLDLSQKTCLRSSGTSEEKSKIARSCVDCEEPIPRDRLTALPSAIRCVTCQQAFEKTREYRIFIDEGMGGTRDDNKRERGQVLRGIRERGRGH